MLKLSPSFAGVNVLRILSLIIVFALAGPSLAGTPKDPWGELVKAAVQSQQKGDLKAAERSLLKALLAAEAFGDSDPRAAYTLDYLGTLYQQRGDSAEALAVFGRAQAGFAKALGPESPEALDSEQRLADAYAAAQRWAQAEPLYRASLERERARKPADPVALAGACTDLGLALDAQEQWPAALKLYQEAEKLRRKALGDDAPEVAETLNNQGRVHLLRGDLRQAERMIRQALAIDEQALGEQHPAVADDLRRLSAVLFRAGKLEESKALGERAEALDNDRAPTPKPRRVAAPKD
jgi:tetratricopeptide (TPR) repeat protein